MNIKVLVIGSGSIGQRHIKALKMLGIKEIAIYKTNKGTIKQPPTVISENIIIFYDLNKAFEWEPTHIIISNPTSLHLEYILKSINTGAYIFVEKPVLDDYDKIDIMVKNKIMNSSIVVGYNLRFHSIFNFIKNKIKNNDYGNVLKANLIVGHYLPFWHPYEDYRFSYAAKKELGGGTLKTLSHEIDLALYFFDKIIRVFANIQKISDLEIDVDDYCMVSLVTEGCRSVVLEMDFLNPTPLRQGKILFKKGLLEYDYFAQKVFFTSYESREKQMIYESGEDYDKQYIRQMDAFIANNSNDICKIKEGLSVDEIISLCELSNNNGKVICLD
ncbi:MAG: Gfo/Idh/MocA family oxidoreductase [Melioribacteraceae bacterium]|nr:Gfo/Idh/MocA family oxidoreductase [Saprospiraceae bacterium]MCF8355745.1 Gfo/Idh/MocA family oxidoreductase [Melioribacteraceae bacterium]MCF8394773.1 Gfo/Idh/MocA family oxidoreductase [Melioribacteraceae bacterium]